MSSRGSIWSMPESALKELFAQLNEDADAEDGDTRVIDDLLVRLDADDEHRARIRRASFLRFGGSSWWIDSRSGHALDHVKAWRRQ